MGSSIPEESTFRFLSIGAGPNQVTGGAFTDNGTAGNGAQTDNASGSINIPMKGTKAIASTANPDPDDAVVLWAVRPLEDIFRRAVSGDKQWACELRIGFPDGVPSVNDNVAFGIALINESSPLGATVDGFIFTIEFTLANVNPRVRGHTFINGAVANAVNGTATAGVEGVLGVLRRILTGAGTNGSLNPSLGIAGLDSAKVPVSGGGATTANAITTIGTGTWYVLVFAYRTLSGDTDNITPAPRFGYSIGTQKAT